MLNVALIKFFTTGMLPHHLEYQLNSVPSRLAYQIFVT